MVREFKDKFTLDGLLKPQLGVTPAKVKAVQGLVEKALAGDFIADATLREAVTTSDAMFNVGHLVNLQTIPQLDKADKSITGLAGFRTVKDFRPTALQSLFGNLTGAGIGPNGEAVEVPEGTSYPKVTITGQESFYQKLTKRGVSFSFTWEAAVNDTVGFFEGLPDDLLTLTDSTQYAEVFDALLTATAGLPVVALPDGASSLINSPATATGILAAIQTLAERTVNGNKIGTLSGYNVIVATGRKAFVEYSIRQAMNILYVLPSSAGGNVNVAPDNSVLGSVEIIESDRVTGANWFLLPKPGASKGRPVLELLRLRGYETPELRVQNNQGSYIGGGRIAPFEGSFEADVIDYRYRYVCGGVLWDTAWVVRSSGAGS